MDVKPLLFDSYLAVIRNAPGTRMFRNFYASVDGVRTDIMMGGELSCAMFASSVLMLFRLIKEPHATVDSTVKDMLDSGWVTLTEPREGCVLVWAPSDLGGSEPHPHIGFFMGADRVISNSTTQGMPAEHDWTYDGSRKPVAMYWHARLGE
ncbi:MAG: hypothetical protein RLZZ324_1067 [Candidatus Parcubacteria bacterium]|jgi:hypothetical protein